MPTSILRGQLPPTVVLEPGAGNLPRVRVSNAHADAEIYLHGAHVTAWTPKEQSPVLWMSRESHFDVTKPIRGGVPLCFPWFGAHATAKTAPAHGYARLADWALVDAREDRGGITTLAFQLSSESIEWPAWPHRFEAVFRVSVGAVLGMSLDVRNTGAEPFTFEEALHTYVAVQDVKAIGIAGLERTEYLDKVDGMSRKRQGDEPIRFTGETDRIFLDTAAACTIDDPGRHRRIVVSKSGSNATVVWNPWVDKGRAMPDFGDDEWREMVCVETCNVGASAVALAPGARHTMDANVQVIAS